MATESTQAWIQAFFRSRQCPLSDQQLVAAMQLLLRVLAECARRHVPGEETVGCLVGDAVRPTIPEEQWPT